MVWWTKWVPKAFHMIFSCLGGLVDKYFNKLSCYSEKVCHQVCLYHRQEYLEAIWCAISADLGLLPVFSILCQEKACILHTSDVINRLPLSLTIEKNSPFSSRHVLPLTGLWTGLSSCLALFFLRRVCVEILVFKFFDWCVRLHFLLSLFPGQHDS